MRVYAEFLLHAGKQANLEQGLQLNGHFQIHGFAGDTYQVRYRRNWPTRREDSSSLSTDRSISKVNHESRGFWSKN